MSLPIQPIADSQRQSDRLEIRSLDQLAPSEIQVWRQLNQQTGDRSPFLSYLYSASVHAERGDVRVLLGFENDKLCGVFPLQVSARGHAEAVGSPYSDRQGILGYFPSQIDLDQQLRKLGIRKIAFRYATESNSWLKKLTLVQESNPRIRLPFAHQFRKEKRKRKRLEKQVGRVRFVADCRDPEVMEHLIRWKRQQCLRTGFGDLFAPAWIQGLLSRLQDSKSDECRGQLSALFVNDRPIAAHFGIYSETTAHAWFPAFDRRFEQYSPGLLLWVELIKEASELGLEWFDFGAGDECFKYRWATDVSKLNAGMWTSSWVGWLPKARLYSKRYAHLDAYRRMRSLVRSYRKVRWTKECRELERETQSERASGQRLRLISVFDEGPLAIPTPAKTEPKRPVADLSSEAVIGKAYHESRSERPA